MSIESDCNRCVEIGGCLDPGSLLKPGTFNCMSYLLSEAEQYGDENQARSKPMTVLMVLHMRAWSATVLIKCDPFF